MGKKPIVDDWGTWPRAPPPGTCSFISEIIAECFQTNLAVTECTVFAYVHSANQCSRKRVQQLKNVKSCFLDFEKRTSYV